MHTRKRIQHEIIVLSLLFAVLIGLMVSAGSVYSAYLESCRATVQGTEYALQLAAGDLQQSASEIDSLADWCVADTSVRNYALYSYDSHDLMLSTYNTISNRYLSMHASRYILRFILANGSNRLIQLGTIISQSQSLTPEGSLEKFPFFFEGSRDNSWSMVCIDPLVLFNEVQYIPVTRTIYGSGGKTASVYIAVSVSMITDYLRSSDLLDDSALYWIMNGHIYEVNSSGLTILPDEKLTRTQMPDNIRLLDLRTAVWKLNSGELLLGSPVGSSGMYIAKTVPLAPLWEELPSLPRSLLYSVMVILTLGVILALLLRRVVAVPVKALQDQLERVGQGDFSPNHDIEWNNEMGDIGRGINGLSERMLTMMNRRLEDEKAKQDLEYRMLQNQINPHFLYNTLNSIKWMATIQHAPGIAEMTTALSRLLKSVSKGNEKLVPLQEEFALLNDYFTIQQYRYGGTITMDVTYIEDERFCQNVLISRFTLQPLVENAIFHGIEPKGCAGSIELTVAHAPDSSDVLIVLTDDGVGMTPEQAAKALTEPGPAEAAAKYRHVGMWNVHRRLQYSFGDGYGLSISSTVGQGTSVTVRLPGNSQQKGVQA